MHKITGKITAVASISGNLSAQGNLSGTIRVSGTSRVEEYDGEYTVTPRLAEQTLPTGGKKMRDDLTVLEIPVVLTSNNYGGKTVVIG